MCYIILIKYNSFLEKQNCFKLILFERWDREKIRDLWPVGSLPNCPKWHGLGRTTASSQEFHPVSHMGGRDPAPESLPAAYY